MRRFTSTTPMVVLSSILLWACGEDAADAPALLAIDATSVAVNDTLELTLAVRNTAGEALEYTYTGPDLPGLEAVAELAGTPSGGVFRWTPLVSHVGQHEFTFTVRSSAGDSSQSVLITVIPPSDAAPVFLRPGAGGIYDLERSNEVQFDIEVRDADTAQVAIRAGDELPDGARITSEGPKRASFTWIPRDDQIDTAQRWTVLLEADDLDHPPTQHSYVIQLRSPPKEDCPGTAPTVRVDSPTDESRVVSAAGYRVVATVADDQGLREPPVLIYTTVRPEDPDSPDLNAFEDTIEFAQTGSTWTATVPSLDLPEGEERAVYYIVSATDNDDSAGTACDHVTDTSLRSFVAVGGRPGEDLVEACGGCSASAECDTGVCATGAGGGRCLVACASTACGTGTCQATTTTDGSSVQACGSVAVVCNGQAETCENDASESNDTSAEATTFVGPSMTGTVCPLDDDYYRIEPGGPARVTVTLDQFTHTDGDLDIQLKAANGENLALSDGITDEERIEYVVADDAPLFVRVYAFSNHQNDYRLTVNIETILVCTDDDLEENDEFNDSAVIDIGETLDGTICPNDDDWFVFIAEEAGTVTIVLDHDFFEGDLDLELRDDFGEFITESASANPSERIEQDVSEGVYTIVVFGFLGDSADYSLSVQLESPDCTTDGECAQGTICVASECVDAACSEAVACPETHYCPLFDTSADASVCSIACSTNRTCRSDEACKWFEEQRGCGVRGSGLNGDACESFADCGGQRTCLQFLSGGYCARARCTANSQCESDTTCVQLGGDVGYCLKTCDGPVDQPDPDACRQDPAYSCLMTTDIEAGQHFVCRVASE